VPPLVLRQAGAVTAECPRCGGRWQVFADLHQSERRPPEFVEHERRREVGRTQVRTIRSSASELEQTTTIAHEWRQSVKLGTDRTRDSSFGVKLRSPLTEFTAGALLRHVQTGTLPDERRHGDPFARHTMNWPLHAAA
jgi:hypothetical protein